MGQISRRKNSAETSRPADDLGRSDCFSRIPKRAVRHRPDSSRRRRYFHRCHARVKKNNLMSFPARFISALSSGSGIGVISPSRKNVACNPDRQVNSGYEKGPLKNSSSRQPQSGHNRAAIPESWLLQIHDPADGSNTFARRNQGRNRPLNGSSKSTAQSAQTQSTSQRPVPSARKARQNAQPHGGSAN